MLIQRLQNIPLTSWIWQFWQHEETGSLVMLPFWKKPGRRYYKIRLAAINKSIADTGQTASKEVLNDRDFEKGVQEKTETNDFHLL